MGNSCISQGLCSLIHMDEISQLCIHWYTDHIMVWQYMDSFTFNGSDTKSHINRCDLQVWQSTSLN